LIPEICNTLLNNLTNTHDKELSIFQIEIATYLSTNTEQVLNDYILPMMWGTGSVVVRVEHKVVHFYVDTDAFPLSVQQDEEFPAEL
jgi:hypothetical protein